MVQFPDTVSPQVAKVIKSLFRQKTRKTWDSVHLLNVRVKEEEYRQQGRTYISHDVIFEMYDAELKNMISINENQYRRYRQKLIDQKSKQTSKQPN